MIRQIKRYFALRAYVKRLSQELARRYNVRPFYTIEQVIQAARKSGFDEEYIAYAHAMFCNRADFEANTELLGKAYDYDALRRVVGRRFMGGTTGFDALNIIRKYRVSETAGFSESGIGHD